MSRIINLVGKRFGKLTVIKRAENYISPSGNKIARWLCKCDCGNEKVINSSALVRGSTKSCGCIWYKEVACGNKTHGMSESRLYECWRDMRNRCYLKTRYDYHRYGGRGIKVCEEWKNSFEEFMKWALSNGYKDDLTIDRIDVNKDYCPENCRWVDRKTQAINRRTSILIEYKGKKLCLKGWAELFDKPRYIWYSKKYKNMDRVDILKEWDNNGFNKRL